jgi:PIN domain nuclease of toxin-antitoxin system
LEHAEEVSALPLHDRDPFDRMLLAKARVENLTLVTGDRRLEAYAVHRFWTQAP